MKNIRSASTRVESSPPRHHGLPAVVVVAGAGGEAGRADVLGEGHSLAQGEDSEVIVNSSVIVVRMVLHTTNLATHFVLCYLICIHYVYTDFLYSILTTKQILCTM